MTPAQLLVEQLSEQRPRGVGVHMRLDERVREAMLRKGQTGWRAWEQDIRRFSHLDPAVVLLELRSS